jgi:hypothetical protein
LYEFSAPGKLQKDTEFVVGKPISRESFQDVVDYLGLARKTSTTLDSYLAGLPSDNSLQEADIAALDQERQAAIKAANEVSQSLSSEPAVMSAVDFALFEQP